jgi:hypothetical protein
LVEDVSSSFPLDTRPSYPRNLTAVFRDLKFAQPSSDVELIGHGFFHELTFTSAWLPGSSLRVGPIYDLDGISDVALPVVVALVTIPFSRFTLSAWIAAMVKPLGVQPYDVEVTRLSQSAIASSGSAPSWTGTRIEFRFNSPSPSTPQRASSESLAALFLSQQPVCTLKNLLIHRTFPLNESATECDLFFLDQQALAAQLCYSDGGMPCGCYEPVFATLGSACRETDRMVHLCTALSTCQSSSITSGCAFYSTNVYLQYALVGIYSLLGLLFLYAVYLWRSQRIQKSLRAKLQLRDHVSGGARRSRVKREHVDGFQEILL